MKKIALGVGGLFGIAVLGLGGVVAYAAATAEGRDEFPDTPAPSLTASSDPAIIAQGDYLVHGPAHCAQCHSTGDRDHPELSKTAPLSGGLAFEMGPIGASYAANLTPDSETGIGRFTDAQIARTVRTGVRPNGKLSMMMRFSAAKPADEDLVAIISYLRSMQPVKNAIPEGHWGIGGKVMLAFFSMTPSAAPAPTYVPASDTPSVERGHYIAHSLALCVGCHSKFDMSTFEPVEPFFAGGDPDPSHGSDHDMEYTPPNLTSDPSGITGKLDEDAFVARLRSGRAYPSSIMPWEGISSMTEADMRSVYRYLKSVPPVHNDLGPSYRKQGSWKAPE